MIDSEYILVYFDEYRYQTDQSRLLEIDGEEFWVPISVTREFDADDYGDSGMCEIEKWFCDQEGIEYD